MAKEKVNLTPEQKKRERSRALSRIRKDKWMYLLLLPGVLYFIIFKFVPMWGVLIAFKDYYAGLSFPRRSGSDFGILPISLLIPTFCGCLRTL